MSFHIAGKKIALRRQQVCLSVLLRRYEVTIVAVLLLTVSVKPSWAQVYAINTAADGEPNNVPAVKVSIGSPASVAQATAGNVYITSGSENVFKLDTNGNLTIVAGNGFAGDLGDSGPATQAELRGPSGLSVDTLGNIFIADTGNNVIREVVAKTGIIQTVAGNGTGAYSGEGGPATQEELNVPSGVFVDSHVFFHLFTQPAVAEEEGAAAGGVEVGLGRGGAGKLLRRPSKPFCRP